MPCCQKPVIGSRVRAADVVCRFSPRRAATRAADKSLAGILMDLDFSVNSNPEVKVVYVGNEQLPVIVVDDLMKNPEELLKFAGNGADFESNDEDYYPGVRKPLPANYAANIADASSPLLRKVFKLDSFDCAVAPEIGVCSLAITSCAPAKLLPIQCIPHFDSSNTCQFAVVHYLCQSHYGGTSFYRHKHTGYESVDPSRYRNYTKTLERQATTVGLPKQEYINGDTALFTRVASFPARFNRAIFYHSHALHSGNIQSDLGFSVDPRKGRLTATTSLVFK